jgi:hypothetical protein
VHRSKSGSLSHVRSGSFAPDRKACDSRYVRFAPKADKRVDGSVRRVFTGKLPCAALPRLLAGRSRRRPEPRNPERQPLCVKHRRPVAGNATDRKKGKLIAVQKSPPRGVISRRALPLIQSQRGRSPGRPKVGTETKNCRSGRRLWNRKIWPGGCHGPLARAHARCTWCSSMAGRESRC